METTSYICWKLRPVAMALLIMGFAGCVLENVEFDDMNDDPAVTMGQEALANGSGPISTNRIVLVETPQGYATGFLLENKDIVMTARHAVADEGDCRPLSDLTISGDTTGDISVDDSLCTNGPYSFTNDWAILHLAQPINATPYSLVTANHSVQSNDWVLTWGRGGVHDSNGNCVSGGQDARCGSTRIYDFPAPKSVGTMRNPMQWVAEVTRAGPYFTVVKRCPTVVRAGASVAQRSESAQTIAISSRPYTASSVSKKVRRVARSRPMRATHCSVARAALVRAA